VLDFYDVLEAARHHGEDGDTDDGATHEVGDLQEFATELWSMLTEEQRRAALTSEVVQRIFESGWDEDLAKYDTAFGESVV